MATVYEIITDRMIKAITENNVLPWQKPWRAGRVALPYSSVSKKPYRGINVFMLLMAGFDCPQWATYKQITEMGGTVRKGQHGWPIVFWKLLDDKKDPNAAPDEISSADKHDRRLLRYYTVFNLSQTEGIEFDAGYNPVDNQIGPIEAAARIVNGYKLAPALAMGGSKAFYKPSTDTITMPDLNRWANPESFYGVLFHEMVHSTGHEKRLNREGVTDLTPFGSVQYGREELTAEMGAAFLKAHAGITSADEFENSAGYVANWLKCIKADPKLLIQAGGAAQKAADHILGIDWTQK